MDVQYRFLKLVCKLSAGERWVTYEEVEKRWNKHLCGIIKGWKCPSKNTILNLANHTYVDVDYKTKETHSYFPDPKAFSYVAQRKDSIRNLVVTTLTLLISAVTLAMTIAGIFVNV